MERESDGPEIAGQRDGARICDGSPRGLGEVAGGLEAGELGAAVAETFFSTLEHELGGEAKWATRKEAMQAVSEYIDGFYNPTRRHSTIGSLSPIEFERRAQRSIPGSRGTGPAPPRSSEKDRNQESPSAATPPPTSPTRQPKPTANATPRRSR